MSEKKREQYICLHPAHRGIPCGGRIGEFPLEKCLKRKCRWLGKIIRVETFD